MIKNKIPTLFALVILIAGAFFGVMFLDQDTDFLPRAAPEIPPQNVRITNITESGFVVSWTTSQPTIGFIKLGSDQSKLSTSYQDDRDQLSGSLGSFRTHYVTITGLTPNSPYYFRIGAENQHLFDQRGKAYNTATAPSISQPPSSNNLTGSVFSPVNTPAEGALVYLTFENSSPLSALVKQNGNWNINLNIARSVDLQRLVEYQPASTALEILVNDASNPNTVVVTQPETYQVEPIIIGKNKLSLQSNTPAQVESPQTLGAQDTASPSSELNNTASPTPTQSLALDSSNEERLGTPSASLVAGNTTVSLGIFATGLIAFILGLVLIFLPAKT